MKTIKIHQQKHPVYHYPLLFVLAVVLILAGFVAAKKIVDTREGHRQTRAYQNGGRFIFPDIGLSFILPNPAKPPAVGGAEGMGALIPLPDGFPETSRFTVETTTNPNGLPLERLNEITYGYEHLSPEPFVEENETVTDKQVVQIGAIGALALTTSSSDATKYYTFVPAGPLVYCFILSIPAGTEGIMSGRAHSVITTLVRSVQFFTPNR